MAFRFDPTYHAMIANVCVFIPGRCTYFSSTKKRGTATHPIPELAFAKQSVGKLSDVRSEASTEAKRRQHPGVASEASDPSLSSLSADPSR